MTAGAGRPPWGADAVTQLLERAAAAGHTCVPVPLLARLLAEGGVGQARAALEAAVGESGSAVLCDPLPGDAPDAPELLGLERWVMAEEALAEALGRLVAAASPTRAAVEVVVTPPGSDVDGEAARLRDVPGVLVATEAETLDVEAAAALAEPLEDGQRLVLLGDPARLPSRGPGRVLADLVGSGVVGVRELPGPGADPAGGGVHPAVALATAVRAGRLPDVAPDPQHRLVVVPAADDAGVAARVRQVVTDSLPRTFGTGPGDVAVLLPDAGAVPAVGRLLGGAAEVLAVADAAGRTWPAGVVALPRAQAGSVTRPMLLTALTRGRRQVTVVSACGRLLEQAVKQRTGPARSTRLAGLLRSLGAAGEE